MKATAIWMIAGGKGRLQRDGKLKVLWNDGSLNWIDSEWSEMSWSNRDWLIWMLCCEEDWILILPSSGGYDTLFGSAMPSNVQWSRDEHERPHKMYANDLGTGVANEMERDARNEMEHDARNERWNEVNCWTLEDSFCVWNCDVLALGASARIWTSLTSLLTDYCIEFNVNEKHWRLRLEIDMTKMLCHEEGAGWCWSCCYWYCYSSIWSMMLTFVPSLLERDVLWDVLVLKMDMYSLSEGGFEVDVQFWKWILCDEILLW